MRIRTLLNQCQKYKSFSFVKEYIEDFKGGPALIVEIDARKNGKPICIVMENLSLNMAKYPLFSMINSFQYGRLSLLSLSTTTGKLQKMWRKN